MEAGNKIAYERAVAQGKRAEQLSTVQYDVTLEEALSQVKKFEQLQTKQFQEKRKKQRDGLIRSGKYDPAWNQAVRDYHDGKDTID